MTLHLRTPTVIAGLLRPTVPVTTIHLAADDGLVFAQALQARLDAAPPSARPVAVLA